MNSAHDRDKRNNDLRKLIVFEVQSEHAKHHKLGHVNHEPCDCRGVRLKEVMHNAPAS